MKPKLLLLISIMTMSSCAQADIAPDECTQMLTAHANGLRLALQMEGLTSKRKADQARNELEFIESSKNKISDCEIQSQLPSYIQKQKALKAGKEAVEKLKASGK